MKLLFFGSTPDSVIVLEKLVTCHLSRITLQLIAVVTPPPRPIDRKQITTPTPVEVWAKERKIPVFSFPNHPDRPWLFLNDQTVIDILLPLKADLLISASFGQKIPWPLIAVTPYGGLNIHPSLLPRWRGANPVPWAILTGDKQTGVTVVTLSERFDQGVILAQQKVPIEETDLADPLCTKLFILGADLLVEILTTFKGATFKGVSFKGKATPSVPPLKIRGGEGELPRQFPYARRLKREDGFLPWELFQAAIAGTPASAIQPYSHLTIVKDYLRLQKDWVKEKSLGSVLARFFRALHPWPGIWTETKVTSNKKQVTRRLKILACHLSPVTYHLSLDLVQLEGKNPVSFIEFNRAYKVLSLAEATSSFNDKTNQ